MGHLKGSKVQSNFPSFRLKLIPSHSATYDQVQHTSGRRIAETPTPAFNTQVAMTNSLNFLQTVHALLQAFPEWFLPHPPSGTSELGPL